MSNQNLQRKYSNFDFTHSNDGVYRCLCHPLLISKTSNTFKPKNFNEWLRVKKRKNAIKMKRGKKNKCLKGSASFL